MNDKEQERKGLMTALKSIFTLLDGNHCTVNHLCDQFPQFAPILIVRGVNRLLTAGYIERRGSKAGRGFYGLKRGCVDRKGREDFLKWRCAIEDEKDKEYFEKELEAAKEFELSEYTGAKYIDDGGDEE